MDFYAWQIEAARALQSLGPWLMAPMKFFTFLGREEFYLAFMPLIFWCFNKSLGIDLSLLLIFSSGIDNWAKGLFKQPRPYWVDKSLMLDTDVSFGIPSGHAMNAVSLWGYLAIIWRSAWRWLLVAIVVLISLSRIYLGVHFPTDVLAGWLLGLLLIWAYFKLKPRAGAWLGRLSLAMHLVYALAALVVVLLLFTFAGAIPLGQPGAYGQLYATAVDDFRQSAGTTGGMLFGAWIGLALEARYVRFSVGGTAGRRAIRYVIGIVVVVAIWFGLKIIFPAGSDAVAIAFRIVRYALLMLWTIVGWPWLWVKVGLGETAAPSGAGAFPDGKLTPMR